MTDRDISPPDPLRMKVFGPGPMPVEERLGYALEFVALLDDRVKELENLVTNVLVPSTPPEPER